jgi:hypothetical protein
MARCSCGALKASNSPSLAFFEFRGEGSRAAEQTCANCGYAYTPHVAELIKDFIIKETVIEAGKCPGFKARGAWEYDSFYCGCRGWD